MNKELLIEKAKELMKSFEEGNIEKIIEFYHDDCIIQDVGIALAFNKKSVIIRGKKKYKSFLLKVAPKNNTKKNKNNYKEFFD